MRTPVVPNLLLAFLLLLAAASCYEDREGCLDPDATNFDLLADGGCADCCTYPDLALRITHRWDSLIFDPTQAYTDGGGNTFRVVRFRYYLGDLVLLSDGEPLPVPDRPLTVSTVAGGDTATATVNANLLLAAATAGTSTSTVGSLRLGTTPLTALSGSFGLPEDLQAVFPPSAPSGSPLRTQPGLLNFNDGQGYVRLRLEYTLEGAADTLSVATFGQDPFVLDFGGSLTPVRGFDLTLLLRADLARVLGEVDLAQPVATVGAALNARLSELLTVTGAQQ